MSHAAAKCSKCGKTVYTQEMLRTDADTFHKTCFRCCHCKGQLKLGNYAALKGNYYCKPHFKQLFQLRGNYDGGFGEEQHKMKWVSGERGTGSPAPSHPTPSPASQEKHDDEEVDMAPLHVTTPPPVDTPSLSGLTMEEVESAQVAFKKYDLNGNGTLDKTEFLAMMVDIMARRGTPVEPAVAKILAETKFREVDKDGSGDIDEQEFLIVYSEMILAIERQEHLKGK